MNRLHKYGDMTAGAALYFSLIACAVTTNAQVPQPGYEYAAKIVCGLQKDPQAMILTRGFYGTTVNIHNPSTATVTFTKTLALTVPPLEQRPGEVRPCANDALKPEEALKTDCDDIRKKLFPAGFANGYIEGFVIIHATNSLDVTAVYTTASVDKNGEFLQHSGIHVEQIRERGPAATGVADLIPLPGCQRQGLTLLVTIVNQGTGPAAASTTQVDFGGLGKVNAPTPMLAAGASAQVPVAIPTGCFSPDCSFRTTADILTVVPESNEANNSSSGSCLG